MNAEPARWDMGYGIWAAALHPPSSIFHLPSSTVLPGRWLLPFSYSLGCAEVVTSVFLRMGEGQRQRIRGIRRRRFGQAQEALHHFCDGKLLRGAITHDGLLDFAWRQFIDFQTGLRDGGQRRPASFSHN